ncbi:cystine transport system permease protein [Weissella beninensis]|uniref:Amino acid ABC transporter permease n=1 Tax=Periweissella beninensis TaxID=504936 RepID=A0ABT0VHL5_9LACO|nr:amino acid ABC transporter permease [Periweissella beninensis]MBM7543372.1 cystine transport system permease protein [Periweissella beninensis]MCM2437331.1 amino acid ABC transporter permease [Periweissella beninensis]
MDQLIAHLSVPNFFNAPLAWHSLPYILQGLPLTIELTIVSFIGQLILGFILTLGQMSKKKLIFGITRTYISFMRGTPILVILFLIYFGLPYANYQIPAFSAAALAFILNGAAFVSEIFRSAFLGVDKGQYDAAKSLGMPYFKIIRYIIFPQALRIAIPALGNVILDLFKGTSLAAMITVSEMFMHAKIVAGRNFDYMTIYIEIALVYWACCSLITWGQSHLEKHLDYN